jgi:uncharacterized protein YcbK (DUF882 family)
MITRDEVLMGRDKEFPLTPELEANLAKLLTALNKYRAIYGSPMLVSSGYRPGHYNRDAGGAAHSSHVVCLACDFHDSDGQLKAWVAANLHVLEDCGLYMEDPTHTKTWLHLTVQAPKSGHRVFIP